MKEPFRGKGTFPETGVRKAGTEPAAVKGCVVQKAEVLLAEDTVGPKVWAVPGTSGHWRGGPGKKKGRKKLQRLHEHMMARLMLSLFCQLLGCHGV